MTKAKKRLIACALIIGIPLIIALMAYIMVSIYYMDRFFPGTHINGMDFSNKTTKEAEQMLEDYHNNYTFRLIERDGSSEVLNGSDIGHKIVFEGIEDVKGEQNTWLWPAEISDRSFYTVDGGHGYDEAKLTAALESLDCMTKDIVEPQDAYVDLSDGIKIVPEVKGTKLDFDKLKEAVGTAISAGEVRLDLDAAGCYENPEITVDSEEFKEKTEPITKLTKATITLNIGDDTEVIDASVSEGFLVQTEEGGIDIDAEKVKAYMEAMEQKYDTTGDSHEFTTTGGSVVSLTGTLGFSIAAETETEKIIEELKAGEDVTREITYDATAPMWEGNQIGDTYVEISIADQHMWFYKNGNLVIETDIVTGNSSEGYDTPTGAYTLLNKQRDQTLIGADPSDPYQSYVAYWLPFIGNLYGIHDASWRSTFGGDIYTYGGSHGCVNTPYNNVQVIFENIEIGTPVLIY